MENSILIYSHPYEGMHLYDPRKQKHDSCFFYFWVHRKATLRLIDKSKVDLFLLDFDNYVDICMARSAHRYYENWLRHIQQSGSGNFKDYGAGDGMHRDSSGRLADADGNTLFGYYDSLYSSGDWRAYTPYT